MPRWLKARVDGVMRVFKYEPVETALALEQEAIAIRDWDRDAKERLDLTLAAADAKIIDIKELLDEKAALPADAPAAMLWHLTNKMGNLISNLAAEAQRRKAAREHAKEKARWRDRDPKTGRWLASPKEVV